jgi:hypothetical protein
MSYWVKLNAKLMTNGKSLKPTTPRMNGNTNRKPIFLFSYMPEISEG